ncbi:MAG: DsrE family protein [Nitrospirae bacterium YQR-1]
MSEEEKTDKEFVFIITRSHDSVDVVAGALQLAVNMRAYGTVVDFFLMDKAVLLAKAGFAETLIWQQKDQFSPVSDLMKTLAEDFDAKFYICASCVKHYELDKAVLIKNAEIKPGSFLGEMLLSRQGLTF